MSCNLSTIANKYPVLSEEAELDLAKRFKYKNDLEAAQLLALHHIPLCIKVANRYKGYGLPFEDLVQEGFVGLLQAIKKFDYTKGFRLAAFAVHDIKYRISEYVVQNYRLVKIATTKSAKKLFWNRSVVNDESVDTLEKLDVTQEQFDDFETRYAGKEAQIDDAILQVACKSATPEEHLQQRDEYRRIEKLNAAISKLDTRTQYIVKCRWMDNEPKTLQELGDELGISYERVRQVEQQALKKLKQLMVW